MNNYRHPPARRLLLAVLAFTLPLSVAAATAETASATLPAFEADSEAFELVGRIKEGRMTLTLDRWASNEPIADARIEIDSNGRALVAAPQADGTYLLDAAPFARAGTYPLTIAIAAGKENDLLAADLVVASDAGTAPAATGSVRRVALAGAALALIGSVAFLLRRRFRKGERA